MNSATGITNTTVDYYTKIPGTYHQCQGFNPHDINRLSGKELITKIVSNINCVVELSIGETDVPIKIRSFSTVSLNPVRVKEEDLDQNNTISLVAGKPFYVLLKSVKRGRLIAAFEIMRVSPDLQPLVSAQVLPCARDYKSKPNEYNMYTLLQNGSSFCSKLFRRSPNRRYLPYLNPRVIQPQEPSQFYCYEKLDKEEPETPATVYQIQNIYVTQINNYYINNSNNQGHYYQTIVNSPVETGFSLDDLISACNEN